MKHYTVRITRQAKEHLKKIRKYIDEELLNPDAAQKMIAVLKEEISSLSVMPERITFTEEEPWRSLGIHRMTVKNYYVYFWIDEENKRVQVMAVIYTARDQLTQLKMIEIK